MGRKGNYHSLTPLELEIMKVLWETGPATVQLVQGRLSQDRPLAYTTVQTMLNVLFRKGRVKRALKGKAYEYLPMVTREKATSQAMRDIINRLFGGSAEDLVMSLVKTRHLTPEKLAALNRLIEKSHPEQRTREGSHGNR
jgi:BlaI family penicillinase repressor